MLPTMRLLPPLTLVITALLLTACPPEATPPPDLPEEFFVPEDEEKRAGTERTLWQKPGLVIDALGDIEEKVIADIGAGRGFFAKRLAPLSDRVIAIDVDTSYINYLDTLRRLELPPRMRSRLEPRLAPPDDPNLAPNEVDLILIVNTIAYIPNQVRYLQKLMPALRRNGRIVIVDWKKKLTPEGPSQEERIPLYQLERMLKAAGLHIVSTDDTTLEYQYIIIADKLE